MKRKPKNGGGGGDSWMNTYADMVTLLLTFFAVLLSMSTVDEQKLNAFIRSFSNLPQEVIEEIVSTNGTEEVGEEVVINESDGIDELYEMMKEYVEQSASQESIELFKSDNAIYIRFNSALFFEPDEYVLREDSYPILEFVGKGLKQTEKSIRMVNVLGFTATVENGTYWMLSGERAAAVATYFNFDSNFPKDKLTLIGYGNQYPVATNKTEDGRKKNRRVELVILGENSASDFDLSDAMKELYNKDDYPTSGPSGETYQPSNKVTKSTADADKKADTKATTKEKTSTAGTTSTAKPNAASAATPDDVGTTAQASQVPTVEPPPNTP